MTFHSWHPDHYAHAWAFATRAHHGQTYGGAREGERIAYINHLASVAAELIWALPATPDYDGKLAVQCALLHDTLEDTAVTYAELAAEFGEAVAQGVAALSKNPALPDKAAQMQDSLARIRQQPKEIWSVKVADRISNLYEPPYYWNNERKIAYRREAQFILDNLRDGANAG